MVICEVEIGVHPVFQFRSGRNLQIMKTLSVIGCGHVGLVTAVCFASRAYDVVLCARRSKVDATFSE